MSVTNAERETPVSYREQPFRIRAARPSDLTQIVNVLLISFYTQIQATQWLYWILRLGIQEDIKVKIKSPTTQYACLVAITVHPDSASPDSAQADSAQADAADSAPSDSAPSDSAPSDSMQADAVIGTAEVSQRPCETWQLFPRKRAYLSNLAVSPAHRRAGAAQQLLSTCENIALSWGFHNVYLHVMADNAAAQALYSQAGYQLCEVSNPILSGLGLRPQRLLLSKQMP
jgi:ribosomal protein S18 acetylase RimI-like enzyme